MRKFSKALGIAALLGSAVASNSVLAATYYSNTNVTDYGTAAEWDTGSCDSGTANSTTIVAGDTLVICTADTFAPTTALSIANLSTENGGTITGGANLLTVTGNLVNAGALTAGTGHITVGGNFQNTGTALTLTGNITITGAILAGAGTSLTGTGQMILTDANHTITGPVNVHNLNIASITAARTITVNGAVTATGTTALNGSGAVNTISFTGASGSFSPTFASTNCANSNTVTGITGCALPVVVPAATAPFASASLLWLFGGALGLFGLFGLNRTRKTAA